MFERIGSGMPAQGHVSSGASVLSETDCLATISSALDTVVNSDSTKGSCVAEVRPLLHLSPLDVMARSCWTSCCPPA